MPILLLAIMVVGIDQLSKYLIQQKMMLGMSIPVVKDIFHITYILNPGAAFGILKHQTAFFVAIAVILLGVVLYLFPRIPPECKMLRWGIGLMGGGAVGNLIDRMKTGYVVDFFDFRIWPVFNIADITIVIGVSCIIYSLLFTSRLKDEKP